MLDQSCDNVTESIGISVGCMWPYSNLRQMHQQYRARCWLNDAAHAIHTGLSII